MTARMCVACIGFVAVGVLAVQQIPSDIPPGKEVRTGGFLLWRAENPVLGLRFADMLPLVCGAEDIPGYGLLLPPAPPEGRKDIVRPGEYAHTHIKMGEKTTSVRREWFSLSGLQAYHGGAIQLISRLGNEGNITLLIRLYPQPARQLGQTFAEMQRSSSTVLRRGMPSGYPLGEENCHLPNKIGGGTVWFVYDRATVEVSASSSIKLAEAIAHSTLYRLLLHPKGVVARVEVPRIAVEGRLLQHSGLVTLHGVAVAPVSALSPFGVQAQVSRTS